MTIEYRWAQGEHNRLPTLVADLIQRKVAVIVIVLAACGTCRRRGTRTVPIVFVIGADPVKVWSCRQSQSTRRERYWREFLGQ